MCRLFISFCNDERGSLLLTDWLFLTTILLIGIVPAMLHARDQVNRALTKPVTSWSVQPPILGR